MNHTTKGRKPMNHTTFERVNPGRYIRAFSLIEVFIIAAAAIVLLTGCMAGQVLTTATMGETVTRLDVNTAKGTGIQPVPATATAETALAVCVVKDGFGAVHVRSGAGMDWPVVGYVYPGETLTITGEPVNGWQPVTFHGEAGYFYTGSWCDIHEVDYE